MPGLIDKTIAALVDTIIEEAGIPASPEDRDFTERYVRQTIDQMPDYFRLGFRILALAFAFASVPAQGRRFHLLAKEDRQKQLRNWRRSSLAFRRSMIAFYESFALFGIYSNVHRGVDADFA